MISSDQNEGKLGVRIENFGLTCYMNSVLQSLLRIPSLVEPIESHSHEPSNYFQCILCLLKEIFF